MNVGSATLTVSCTGQTDQAS